MGEALKIKQNYGRIDVAKFFAALLVVAIHVRPLTTYSEVANFILVSGFCRIAVPFFFLTAGYFLGKKGFASPKLIGNYLRRIFFLYCLWSLLYLPIVLESWGLAGYLRKFLTTGSYYHLWYFPALFLGAVLTVVCFRLIGAKGTLLLSFLLYGIGCLGEAYYGLAAAYPVAVQRYFDLFWTTRNGLFFGFFFFALGAYLSGTGRHTRFYLKPSAALIGLALSLGFQFLELFALRRTGIAKDYNMYLSLIPVTLFFFLTLIAPKQRPRHGKNQTSSGIFLFFRKSSVLIFGSHLLFKYYGLKWATVALSAGDAPFAQLFTNNSLVQYTVIIICALLFSVLVLKLEKISCFRFLAYLH